jgi:hypothetical protein
MPRIQRPLSAEDLGQRFKREENRPPDLRPPDHPWRRDSRPARQAQQPNASVPFQNVLLDTQRQYWCVVQNGALVCPSNQRDPLLEHFLPRRCAVLTHFIIAREIEFLSLSCATLPFQNPLNIPVIQASPQHTALSCSKPCPNSTQCGYSPSTSRNCLLESPSHWHLHASMPASATLHNKFVPLICEVILPLRTSPPLLRIKHIQLS